MTPWLYGGSLAAGVLLGWTVRDWKADSDLLASQEAAQAAYESKAQSASDWSRRFETLAQEIRASERTDRLEIREIYRDVEVPSDCAVPDDAARVLERAVERANAAATGKPLDPVPKAAEATQPVD